MVMVMVMVMVLVRSVAVVSRTTVLVLLSNHAW